MIAQKQRLSPCKQVIRGNGSVFKQIAALFEAERRAPVLGWTAVVAASRWKLQPCKCVFPCGLCTLISPLSRIWLANFYRINPLQSSRSSCSCTSALRERAGRRYGAAVFPALFAAVPQKQYIMIIMTTSPPRGNCMASRKERADLRRQQARGYIWW